MKDSFGRTIDYLRISVTDRCNLRCRYCMPEEGVPALKHEEILSFEEIVRICRAAGALGIKKIRLTGGEPLVRKNLSTLVSAIQKLPEVSDITLTTNGVLLKDQLPGLVRAGLNGVNISLDTLDAAEYLAITRRDSVLDALEGLEAALKARPGLCVKINCVPGMQALSSLAAVAGLAKDQPVHVRFIEMMPIGLGSRSPLCTQQTVMDVLKDAYGPLTPLDVKLGNGPAGYYALKGFQGSIGFISAVSHSFCSRCNRIRLTADGYLKTCLQYHTGVSLKELLRSGASDGALKAAMETAIMAKPDGHHFSAPGDGAKKTPAPPDERQAMFQIGG